MRVLLDENVPVRLAGHLAGHDVRTVATEGWRGVKNGDLLRRASTSGFEALITADKSIEYQQELTSRPLRVVVVPVQTMAELQPLLPRILAALDSAAPGRVTHV